MLRLRILGAAAGGGFPQWNCGCPNCAAVRAGDGALEPRTQDSVAVTSDGHSWVLLNASPDVLRQIEANPVLWPRTARDSPIAAIVLTNGDVDHVLGLFALRESQPLAVYATARVLDGLEQNVLLRTLRRFSGHVEFRPLAIGQPVEIEGVDGASTGVVVEAFSAAGKPPIHLAAAFPPHLEDNVGLLLKGRTGGRAAYVTAARSAASVADVVSGSSALLFDGTFFSEDELPRLGLGTARAADMAHVPIGGDDGSLTGLRDLRVERRIYTHVNNTNPILRRDSTERRLVESRGWEVAYDGMEIIV